MSDQLGTTEACSCHCIALKEREKGRAMGRETGGGRERKGEWNNRFWQRFFRGGGKESAPVDFCCNFECLGDHLSVVPTPREESVTKKAGKFGKHFPLGAGTAYTEGYS